MSNKLHTIILLVILGTLTHNAWAKVQGVTIHSGATLTVACDTTQLEPVTRSALQLLAQDVEGVLDAQLRYDKRASKADMILRQDDSQPREGFCLSVEGAKIIIKASDGHGMAYGVLEVSRLMGVSPWVWWADTGYRKLDSWCLEDGYTCQMAPDVDFRGIFINDEDWGLMPWSSQTYEPMGVKGSIGPKTYSRVFELLLRLRANTIWPAMHECSEPFFLTPGNREAAARYGIYMGGSHCEPMACSAAVEWSRRGVGDYDYVNNSAEVRRFWQQRLDEVKDQEILYTIGMRGVHDGAMQGAKTVDEQRAVLTRVLADQREMLSQTLHCPADQVPQVFIPYKEVLDVYNSGLQVPDDVCLMWCDDNYGYIRHFPTPAEQQRRGGNGIYYHASYWGRPHDYLWLGTMSPYLMYQQLHKGYQKGIRRIWILNVGDIKPSEYQTELFMDMAWDMHSIEQGGVSHHMRAFYSRELGSALGNGVQQLMTEWYRLAYICKPEHMGGTRVEEADRKYWSTIRDLALSRADAINRLTSYQQLSDRVEAMATEVPDELRDTYFELVKYPVQGACQLNRKLLLAQFARHAEEAWPTVDAALDSIQSLTRIYNQGYSNQGKWNRMMDWQPRRLPVFGAIPHTVAVEPWPASSEPLSVVNGRNVTDGKVRLCEGLGYEMGAAELCPDSKARYLIEFPADAAAETLPCDSLTLQLHLLPSHPVDGEHLGLWIQVGDAPAQWIDYRTQGRSEEWKQNVLRNQAIRSLRIAMPQGHRAISLQLWTPYEGVVVDQITISSSEL